MVAYTAQRLQTNAAWQAQFQFSGVDLTGWVMIGRAQSTKSSGKYVDLTMADGHITVTDAANGVFTVAISQAESATIGESTVVFEILRTTPTPRRPVLRFTVKNHAGVA